MQSLTVSRRWDLRAFSSLTWAYAWSCACAWSSQFPGECWSFSKTPVDQSFCSFFLWAPWLIYCLIQLQPFTSDRLMLKHSSDVPGERSLQCWERLSEVEQRKAFLVASNRELVGKSYNDFPVEMWLSTSSSPTLLPLVLGMRVMFQGCCSAGE